MPASIPIHQNMAKGPLPLGDPQAIAAAARARTEIVRCPHYAPTPLHRLDGAAREAGVAMVHYKDEAGRFGLSSFKALGGTYAVGRLLADAVQSDGRPADLADLVDGTLRVRTRVVTVTCASDGNHGRAVAAGARLFGCGCVIFLHEGVSSAREEAILALGARVERTAGDYDDSVEIALATARREGWLVVADTSDDPADPVPALVMHGYTLLGREILDQLATAGEAPPTHVFLQGGVGGLAAAMVAFFTEALGEAAPQFVIVEPERADCLFRSAIAGRPVPATGDLDTVMAGLACGEVSRVAWPILAAGADYFATIKDEAAVAMMRRLADGSLGKAIVAGESATAGLAALMLADPAALGLSGESRVLVIGTEGATDPEIYRQLVSDPADEGVRK